MVGDKCEVGARLRIARTRVVSGMSIESIDFADVKEMLPNDMLLVCFLGEGEDVIVPRSSVTKIGTFGAGRFTLPGSPSFSPALGGRSSGKGWRKK